MMLKHFVVGAMILGSTGPAWGACKTINGTSSSEVITGTSGADCIYGKGGHDTIKGAGGDDRLQGDGGDDLFYGNAGRDVFVTDGGMPLAQTNGKYLHPGNVDEIQDFQAGEVINVVGTPEDWYLTTKGGVPRSSDRWLVIEYLGVAEHNVAALLRNGGTFSRSQIIVK
jgi:RTX calcium-binding nonapeptide repeat (4 copies)